MIIPTIIASCEIDSLIEIVEYTKNNEGDLYDIDYLNEIIDDLKSAKTDSVCTLKVYSNEIDTLVELVESAMGRAELKNDWDAHDNYEEILDTLVSAQERAEEEEFSGIYED